MYSIGEVSEMFDLPVSTLRYYDKEGLFPDMMPEMAVYGMIRVVDIREMAGSNQTWQLLRWRWQQWTCGEE